LVPLVIDSAAFRDPSAADMTTAGPELVVRAVLVRALDLDQESSRRLVLARLADLDDGRFQTYTVFVLNAASQPARQALEALMTTAPFKNSFVDRLLAEGKAEGRAEGKAEGEARLVLRVLAARGLQATAEIRERVMSCTDTSQLETWAERAATADSIDEVFDA
jgi:predicted transposase YdaD